MIRSIVSQIFFFSVNNGAAAVSDGENRTAYSI
jgi:hypothetical protein